MDIVMAGVGYYSCSEEGQRWLPMYVVFSGFNGIISLLRTIQDLSGGPKLLSAQYPLVINIAHMVVVAKPIILLLSAYFGYEFIKHARAIFINGEADVDTGPSGFIANMPSFADYSEQPRESFQAFTGEGRRLGLE